VNGAVELTGRQRFDRIAAGKQPASRQQGTEPSALAPPLAQLFEQLRRQHGMAVLATLALLDPQQHTLGVDVADLEGDDFGDTQTGAIGGGERRLVLRSRFRAAAETLLTIAADPTHLGARIGFTAVLHSWGSAMMYHPHVHIIVPGGGISLDGTRWVPCRSGFLLPVRVLSRLFRRLFLAGLAEAHVCIS
jgi:hypothetical protein